MRFTVLETLGELKIFFFIQVWIIAMHSMYRASVSQSPFILREIRDCSSYPTGRGKRADQCHTNYTISQRDTLQALKLHQFCFIKAVCVKSWKPLVEFWAADLHSQGFGGPEYEWCLPWQWIIFFELLTIMLHVPHFSICAQFICS